MKKILILALAAIASTALAADRPNILFCFADDWGRYAHCYQEVDGKPSINSLLKTPVIDKVAREGVLFKNAFVNAPSCTPCRSSLLSGRYFFQTGRGAVLVPAVWDPAIPSYPLMLRDAGYHIGKMYKVWGPGEPHDAPYGGQTYAYEAAGAGMNGFSKMVMAAVGRGKSVEESKNAVYQQVLTNFRTFLDKRPAGAPFCFWYGPRNTHRKWAKGSGKAIWGIEPDSLKGLLPKFMADVPEIREDFADYMGEIQAWDTSIGMMLEELEKRGELQNTLVVISGDHGMPGMPGGKCNLYDFGVGVPLVAKGPGIKSGRIVDDFVNMMDMAPTFLEAGGVKKAEGMTAKSFMNVLTSAKSGQIDPERTWVVTGRERHAQALPYPQRALRTKDFLYVRNFMPDRWPMGEPRFTSRADLPTREALEQNTVVAFTDMDSSPTKSWLVYQFDVPEWQWHYAYAFGKRPGEELYDLRKDGDQTKNLAADPAYASQRKAMADQLMAVLMKEKDPRVTQDPVPYEYSPFTGKKYMAPKK